MSNFVKNLTANCLITHTLYFQYFLTAAYEDIFELLT